MQSILVGLKVGLCDRGGSCIVLTCFRVLLLLSLFHLLNLVLISSTSRAADMARPRLDVRTVQCSADGFHSNSHADVGARHRNRCPLHLSRVGVDGLLEARAAGKCEGHLMKHPSLLNGRVYRCRSCGVRSSRFRFRGRYLLLGSLLLALRLRRLLRVLLCLWGLRRGGRIRCARGWVFICCDRS